MSDEYEILIRRSPDVGWDWRALRNGELWTTGPGRSDGNTLTKWGAKRVARQVIRYDQRRRFRNAGEWQRIPAPPPSQEETP